jgi:hypothetical protein
MSHFLDEAAGAMPALIIYTKGHHLDRQLIKLRSARRLSEDD